ncbi:MAG TPA: hypothetical protein VFO65_01820 [Acidimicrobiales bacterium]|nr:hypothetical protein [Acidimicrobiales bacterium]
MPALEVLDHGDPVTISFDDLLKYHGRSSVAGLAIGFKAMERAFPVLSPGAPPERYDLRVETAFPGGGARDAFEMVARAVTGDRFVVDEAMGPPEAPEAPGGRFFFRLSYRGAAADLVMRPGVVSEKFVARVCRGPASPDEEEHLARLKQDLAARLLGMPAEEAFAVA